MKRAIILIVIGVVIGGGAVYLKNRHAAPDADDNKAAADTASSEATTGAHISHDTNGNVVIAISDEIRKEIGLQLAKPAAVQFSPEIKGYGHVEDTAALAALVTDLASAEAAYAVSSNELDRVTTLAGQGNASARILQAAEAAATHDRLAVQSARDHLLLSSTPALTDRNDLPAFVQSLAAGSASLVRLDLPAGEVPPALPVGARVMSLSGGSADAEFLGAAAATDPQTQGRGYFFLVSSNSAGLAPGEAVTGYLKLPGDPLSGVIVPGDAVVRTEGAGWIYILDSGGKSFTRKAIALDHSTEGGWFVANGIGPGDSIVIVGAQTLLSEELKAAIQPD
ncbi:MAG TPA: hypothetical protein VN048_04085 [Verrucomicrobiae bacterium]|nr:hypothetical protein [Verrucomicrobiae bacterium]